jgi:pyruvate/2-oxoglutarate dehydrogenase complex dihydrolipoamide acyltransferase (E2) component
LKKPLSPAVLNLVLKYGIKDASSIKPSGHGGRLLKGDVLAHLGLISPKPAPKPTFTVAPPRDEIVFAKVTILYS